MDADVEYKKIRGCGGFYKGTRIISAADGVFPLSR